MRLETGSNRLAVLAIHKVVRANGTGEMPSCAAMARPTGVSRTAVVSRLRTTVHATATRTNSSHSTGVRCRPARDAQWPATSNTPAASAISATTVIATKKMRTGSTRSRTSPSSATFTAVAGSRRAVASRTQGRPALPGGSTSTSNDSSSTVGQVAAPAGRRVPPGTARAPPGPACAWPCGWRPGPGPAPSGRRGRPWASTPRHTCSSGSRPRRHVRRPRGGRR